MVKMSSTEIGDCTPTTTPTANPSTIQHNGSSLSFQSQNIQHTTTTIQTNPQLRNNVSVTNIKCEDRLSNCPPILDTTLGHDSLSIPFNGISSSSNNYFNGISSSGSGVSGNNISGNGGGIRIAVPKLEESDESESELTNIENLNVNRRTNIQNKNNGPRPMSWEGELSEPEGELMDTDNITINNHHNHQNHHHHHNNNNSHDKQQLDESQMSIKEEESKTEFDEITIDDTMLTAQIYSTSLKKFQQQHHHNQQHHQQQQQNNEIVNLKYEPNSGNNITVPIGSISITGNTNQQQYTDSNLIMTSGNGGGNNSGLNSPLLARSKICTNLLPANPSPDSAIHSVYTHSSPSQSPLTSRHAPYTPSLSRNNSDASHSSCYSYSSEFSPTHSPIQGRHNIYGSSSGVCGGGGGTIANTNCSNYNNGTNTTSLHHSVLYRPIHDNIIENGISALNRRSNNDNNSSSVAPVTTTASASSSTTTATTTTDILIENDSGVPSPGISRQQLINSPCPICGDKISGFHYGIFSCESCKGFFKRTVQNRKNYVCVRGGPCPVTISTRKKCPACRFDKCLVKGMKLEAIREDRTRGGRSTYQCSYTLPTQLTIPDNSTAIAGLLQANNRMNGCIIKTEGGSSSSSSGGGCIKTDGSSCSSGSFIKTENDIGPGSSSNLANQKINTVPPLLQEIMDVEHLWQYNESELSRLNQTTSNSSTSAANLTTNALLASAGISSNGENTNPDLIATLCNVADHRLYKIVKWCKSLPLFKNISIDDQICLLINSWCELLLFSCCFRSVETPGEIKISLGKTITLSQAKTNGLHACVERMLNLTDHLRRLRVDRFEYVAMKVIVLLQSDTSELREPVKVRQSQEKALQALQSYTLAHYPETPSKFGELLLRIPELQRTCQLGKEMLTIKSKDGEDFNLLMELLRGEH